MSPAVFQSLFSEEALEAVSIERRLLEPPLHVTRYGEGDGSEYLVRSQIHWDVHYRVDMDHPEFPLGHCTCEHYDYRIEPKLRRKQKALRPTCKHVEAVLSEIEHGKTLCECAGLEFSVRLIPTLAQYLR